jgi:hypothetical protein
MSVEEAYLQVYVEGGTTWRIRTLLANHPMTRDEAMSFARQYAERKNIPFVVTDSAD